MRLHWTIGLLITARLAVDASPAAAQCLPKDAKGDNFVYMINLYAFPRDSAWAAARDSLRIGLPGSTGVVQVTKGGACKSANTAYQKKAQGNRATLSGLVYVVQSGATYIVWDPSYRYAVGSGDTYMVFDSNWLFKKGFQ